MNSFAEQESPELNRSMHYSVANGMRKMDSYISQNQWHMREALQ